MAQGLSRVSRGLTSTSKGLGRTTNGFATTRVPMVKAVADPLRSAKNYNLLTQEQKAQSLRQTEQEQRAQLQAIHEKAQSEVDDRNWLEKTLNLNNHQGLIGDIFETISRPMKFVQGAIMGRNPLEALAGTDKFTTEEFLKQGLGIDVSNMGGFGKFVTTFGADVLTDPLTFFDAPIKFAGKGIKLAAVGVGKLTRGALELTETGSKFLKKFDVIKNEVSGKVKEALNLYKDKTYKDFTAATSGKANAVRAAQEHLITYIKDTNELIRKSADIIFQAKNTREYKVLGLDRTASRDEVQKAFRTQVMQSLEQAPKKMTQGDVLKHVLANRTEDGRGVFLMSSAKGSDIAKLDKSVLTPFRDKFEKWLGRPVSAEELSIELGKEGQGAFIKFSKGLMDDIDKQMGRFASIKNRYAEFGLDHSMIGSLNELANTGKVALHLNDPIEKELFDRLSQMFKGTGITAHGAVGEVALTRRQLAQFLKDTGNTDLVGHLMPYLQRRAAEGTLGEAIRLTPEESKQLAKLEGLAGDLPADKRMQFVIDELEGKPQFETMRDKLLKQQAAAKEAVVKQMTAMANATNNYTLKGAYERLAMLNGELGKATQEEIRYTSAIENMNKEIERLKASPEAWVNDIANTQSKITELEGTIKEYKTYVDEARDKYADLQSEVVKMSNDYEDIMNAVMEGKVVPKNIQYYPDQQAWLDHWQATLDSVENALAGGSALDQKVLDEFNSVRDKVFTDYGIETPKYTKLSKDWTVEERKFVNAEHTAVRRYITNKGYELNTALREGRVKTLSKAEVKNELKEMDDFGKGMMPISNELQVTLMDDIFAKAKPSTKNIKLSRVLNFEVPQGGTAVWKTPEAQAAFNKWTNAKAGDIIDDAAYQSTSAGFGYYGDTAAHGSEVLHDATGAKIAQVQDETTGDLWYRNNQTGEMVHENDIEGMNNLVQGQSMNTTVKININAPKGSKMLNMMGEFPDAITMQEVLLNRGSKFKVVNVNTIQNGGLEGALELDVVLMDGDYLKGIDEATANAVAQADKVKEAENLVAQSEAKMTDIKSELDAQIAAKQAAEGSANTEVAKIREDQVMIENKLQSAKEAKEQLGKEVSEAEKAIKQPIPGENRVSKEQVDTIENIVYKGIINPKELKVYAVPTTKAAQNNIKVLNQTMNELNDLAKDGFLTITPTKVPKELLENSELRIMDITRNLEGIKQQIYSTANLLGNSKIEDIARELNIDGYMRHIANPETILWKKLERMGADNPETAKLISNFYKNGSKDQLTMNRKWLGSADDINKSLGIELFNTDPIESMAVMLKILPERFMAINLIDHALETGLIRELGKGETSKFLEEIAAGGTRKEAALKAIPKEYKLVDTNTVNELDRAFNFLKTAGAGDKDLLAMREALDKVKDKGIIHVGLYNKLIHYGKTLSESGVSEVLSMVRKYFLQPWKRVALFSFGYHGRNFLSNMMNAYLAGMHPGTYMKHFSQASSDLYTFERKIMPKIREVMKSGRVELKTTEGQLKLINKSLTSEEKALYNEFMDMYSKGVMGSNKFSADYYDLLNELKGLKNKPGIIRGKVKQISDASMKFGKLSDDASRVAAFRWAHTPKGARHIEKIGLRTPEEFSKFAFFDFHDMSPFEEKYMKSIFPFYAWARKNFEFHVRNFAKQPKRYVRLNHFFKSEQKSFFNNDDEVNEFDAANMLMPVWRKSDGKVVMLKVSPTYLDLGDIMSGNVLSRLNPLIKAPLEAITGRNTFTKRNMEGNLFSQFGTSMLGSPKNLLYALTGQTDKVDKGSLGLIGQKILGVTGAIRSAATGQASAETLVPSMFKTTDPRANELKAQENRVWMLNQQIEALRKQGRYVPTANQLFRRGITTPHTNGRLRNMQTMSSTFAGRRRS